MGASRRSAGERAEDELNLGYRLFHGIGIRRNRRAGLLHYRKAARLGHPKAMFNLGICCEFGDGTAKRGASALRWYRCASARGHMRSAFRIGHGFWWGSLGLKRDHRRAVSWFRTAATRGDAESMGYLGIAHHDGLGVRKDLEQSVLWYRRGARLKDEASFLGLAMLYRDGEGVPRSPRQARWFRAGARRARTSQSGSQGPTAGREPRAGAPKIEARATR